MTQLGSDHIPISGSEAAAKRKQQLEFQVPPHDIDATLCHNLSEGEQTQLKQYVEKIRDNCVGQGMVTRIQQENEKLNDIAENEKDEEKILLNQRDVYVLKNLGYDRENITLNMCTDPILKYLLNSEAIGNLIHPMYATSLHTHEKPLFVDFMQSPYLNDKNKYKLKLMKIDSEIIKGAVMNGPFYDKILKRLDNNKVNFSNDTILNPLKEFRKEYVRNENFKTDLNNFIKSLESDNTLNETLKEMQINETPKHNKYGKESVGGVTEEFQSPLPVKSWTHEGRLISQETPMRKLQFNNRNNPNDQFFANIYNSNAIQNALNDDMTNNTKNKDIILSDKQMREDFSNCLDITDENRNKLSNMNVNSVAVCSSVVSGAIYDKMFQDLDDKNYNVQKCGVLGPIKIFRKEFTRNPQFRNNIKNCAIATNLDLLNDIDDVPFALTKEVPEEKPKAVFKCKECQLSIMSGDVAVQAERAGTDIVWHPKCFICHCCGELLADLVYFYHNGNVYCGRDLANILKIPRCNACDELIFTKEYTAAEDSTFHIKHFCCYQCDETLAGKKYVPDEKSNQPVCLECFDRFHAAKCEHCLSIIAPDEQGVSWGKLHWHGTCFSCSGLNCGKSLIGGKFCVKNNLIFCSPKCVKSVIQ